MPINGYINYRFSTLWRGKSRYTETDKNSQERVQQDFRRVQKSTVFLYTSNANSKNEIKKTIPSVSSIKKNKILRDKFNRRSAWCVHCKTKHAERKWRRSKQVGRHPNVCRWDFPIAKMATFCKLIYRFSPITIKIQVTFWKKLTNWS